MKRQALFMLINGIFVIVPVITCLTGLLDLRQMGFTVPTFFSFALGILLGTLCIPLSYYPMHFVILKRRIEIPLIEKARSLFRTMIPFPYGLNCNEGGHSPRGQPIATRRII